MICAVDFQVIEKKKKSSQYFGTLTDFHAQKDQWKVETILVSAHILIIISENIFFFFCLTGLSFSCLWITNILMAKENHSTFEG